MAKNLGFGLGREVPDTARAAWGARLIISMDGWVDYLANRTDAVGSEDAKLALFDKLNSTFPIDTLRKVVRSKILAGEIDNRNRTVVLFDDDGLKIVANTNASYGYLYVAAWETDDEYRLVEVDGVKVAETRRFTLGAES